MKSNRAQQLTHLALTFGLVAGLLAACQPATPAVDQNVIMTAAFQTAVAQISVPTQTPPAPAATETPVPTATVPRTPPALPGIYQTPLLKPEDTPRTYVTDSCQYLKNKWTSSNSAPGTTVMVVMFHGIVKDATTSSPNQITGQNFKKLMKDMHEMGFQAISTQQMADFMYNNAKIPQLSVLLVVDDRHSAQNFNDWFRPYYEEWGWPVVNAYIGLDERPDLWAENAALSAEGWVDYQSHGYIHNTPISNASTDDFIMGEMGGAIKSIQKYMNKTPIAYIWPGGGFSARAVQIGTQLGYKLGFTVNPRGPVMYNWIPQADNISASNPAAIPETPAGNPLMTIPRYWDTDARNKLDDIREMSSQAAQYAEQNKATELDYYNIVCSPTLGALQ